MGEVSIFEQLRPGYCARWHANPEMAGTECVAAHSARVARIILYFWPFASNTLLTAAVWHDDGEMGLGDVAGPAKRRLPGLADMLDQLEADNREALGCRDERLLPIEAKMLHFADKLAGLLHVKQVRPELLQRPMFQEDVRHLHASINLADEEFPGVFGSLAGAVWSEFGTGLA
jgi:hypothetical protein